MMTSRSLLVLAVPLVLAACGSVREDLGLGRSAPDEFAVIDRPPLSMPPDFGLRPPMPGAPRPQEIDPSVSASNAILGKSDSAVTTAHTASDAERALIQQTGANNVAPDIRTTINNESAVSVDADPHLMDQLLWWKKDNQPGTTVDATAEAERIKQAKEKGEPLNRSATPVIEKDKSGWLGL